MAVCLSRLNLPALAAFFCGAGLTVAASEAPAVAHYRREIAPILNEFCSDCHADGARKGNVAFDEFKSDAEILERRELWLNALKNMRAGLMPPEKKPRPSADQTSKIEAWIKSGVFAIDPANPDPGRITIRRLNRDEYRNTIRDLTGYDYRVEEELPPDDTGFGFDNIGDVLTLSPLLMEKYMQAAEQITAASVPRVALQVPERTLADARPRSSGGKRMSFYEKGEVKHSFNPAKPGTYKIHLDLEIFGQFNFDPGETHVTLKVGENEVFAQDLKWQSHKVLSFEIEQKWDTEPKALTLQLEPITPVEKKLNSLDLRLSGLRIEGPMEKEHWLRPKNFERFFTKDPPENPKERREYAKEVLTRFAEKAYRRPIDATTADRLAAMAESIYQQKDKRFEDGIAETMTPILASPRFLFRIEDAAPAADPKQHPLIDEYALASRLSYFLWSTMPDEELFALARKRELRKNLGAQVKRLLHDARADAFVQHFIGQWLQVRDVEGIDINARSVLDRDGGMEADFQQRRARIELLRDIPEDQQTEEQKAELKELRASFRRRADVQNMMDGTMRRALRDESERVFAYIARENRSVLELIDADYTFLNERLAGHYGIKGVSGQEMRLVKLEEGSPRGGILTQGATLIVTSNPTRTSPVKRGLFVLDNILGMPPPPPPPDVPAIEEAEKDFKERRPTMREALELHRSKPLCASCHNRMDPLGFALENFNAMGMWRVKEQGQPIDAGGSLATGESFTDIRQVKKVLATKYRDNFYRCLTEKMLTYALGRGLEYYDVETVDRIVEQLGRGNGNFSVLLSGIVESAPFQKRRNPEFKDNLPVVKPVETRASLDAP